MAYSVNSIVTKADCDALLSIANKEKSDLAFRKISLERQQSNYSINSVEINTEVTALTTIVNCTCPKKLDTIWGIFMERKVKYGYTFKLECVELVTKKYYSTGYVSKLKAIPETLIRKWIGRFCHQKWIGICLNI